MKTQSFRFNPRHSQRGSAVAAVLGMLAIMAICVSVNLACINNVDRELKLVEKKQAQRLQTKPVKSAKPANEPASKAD